MPRRKSPFLFIDLPLLIIIIPTIAILLLFCAVPSLLSVNSHKIRPNTVKKGWDSLNVFLVLFAILCGIFAKRNDDESTDNGDDRNIHNVVGRKAEQHAAASSNWFDDQLHDQKIQSNRLKRSSSSYPDLRQESLWESLVDRFRSFDDFEISKLRSPTSSSEYIHQRRQQSCMEESSVKEIPVDTFVLRRSVPSPPPKSPAPPPPTPPPPTDYIQSRRRAYKAVSDSSKEKVEREDDSEFNETKSPPPSPPPPPPLPPPASTESDHKYRKRERKKSNATKEIRMAIASIYKQRRRKKKQETRNLYDDMLRLPSERPSFSRPPPTPPPPPPPPPSVFHNLFKKGSKSKRIHSFTPSTSPPPPPPPPPPPSRSSSRRSSRRKILAAPPPPPPPPAPPTLPPKTFGRRNSASTGRPPLPKRIDNVYEENVNTGGQPPLIPMPPPPPPPPFKVPGFRFVVNGDFVKIASTHSSRCSSPDRESTETVNVTDRRDGSGWSVFCPSPDVNVKADTFIARLRDEWRLDKINSMKEKSLGQGPG